MSKYKVEQPLDHILTDALKRYKFRGVCIANHPHTVEWYESAAAAIDAIMSRATSNKLILIDVGYKRVNIWGRDEITAPDDYTDSQPIEERGEITCSCFS